MSASYLQERRASSDGASTSAAEDGCCEAAPPLPPAFLSRRGVHDGRGALMLKNLTYEEMEDWCEHIGERRQRARQLWRWLYADGGLIRSIDEAAPGVANGFSSTFLCAASHGTTVPPCTTLAGCVLFAAFPTLQSCGAHAV